MELGLSEAQLPFGLAIEYAGYNADKEQLVSKAQHLLVSQRAQCIVAPLNVARFETLSGPCDSQGAALIALTLGEDPCFETAERANVFVNSFNLWRAAWMSGFIGAKRFGPRAAVVAGLHDGGYGTTFAFPLGLEAGGGTLIRTAITHRNSRTEDPGSFIEAVASDNPDFIFALYAGKEAGSFLSAYQKLGIKIPLIGFPFLTEGLDSPKPDDLSIEVTSVTVSPKSAELEDRLKAVMKGPPHAYSILAYEAGHLIADAARRFEGPLPHGERLFEALRSSRFMGPRGVTGFGYGGGEGPVFVNDGWIHGEVVEQVDTPPLCAEQYDLARKRLEKQGWLNPYLCA